MFHLHTERKTTPGAGKGLRLLVPGIGGSAGMILSNRFHGESNESEKIDEFMTCLAVNSHGTLSQAS